VSMRRKSVRLALVALVAIGLGATGCDVRSFRVQIPGFESTGVLGLWVWRQDPDSGDFVRYAQIRFGNRFQMYQGAEYLWYTFPAAEGPMSLQTRLDRPSGDPDSALLNLAFLEVPGTFKVSSYTAAAESSLSEGVLIY
jgi:hypothetical protein